MVSCQCQEKVQFIQNKTDFFLFTKMSLNILSFKYENEMFFCLKRWLYLNILFKLIEPIRSVIWIFVLSSSETEVWV